ncbi:MAG: Abi family protein [Saprospiraceae bacterium]
MKFNKPALSISDQITLLRKRGLIIEETSITENFLSHISFHRLKAYAYPYQDLNRGKQHFKTGVRFEMIIQDYIFDRKLKLLIFEAIEKIEIAFRTQIINKYSIAYGSHWYELEDLFHINNYFVNNLERIDRELRSTHEIFIKLYRSKYSHPIRPPVWMALELVSFGTLSKMFENLKRCPEKKQIAAHFGLDIVILESWLHHLSIVRNICAHHSRLWNTDIPSGVKLPKRPKNNWLTNHNNLDIHRVYITLSCIRYLLNVITPDNSFNSELQRLLEEYPKINLRAMNFPDEWKNEPLWK